MLLSARQMTKGASEVETQVRNVNSILKENDKVYQSLFDSVVDLSKELPQSAKENAAALYDIASGGFEAAAGLTVLEQSATAATAGVSTTAVASSALVASLNSYGKGAHEAQDVSDILFKTVDVGVISFEQLAVGMGS